MSVCIYIYRYIYVFVGISGLVTYFLETSGFVVSAGGSYFETGLAEVRVVRRLGSARLGSVHGCGSVQRWRVNCAPEDCRLSWRQSDFSGEDEVL